MFPFLGAIASAIGGAIGKAAVMAKSAAIGLGKGMIGQTTASPIANIAGMGQVPVKPSAAQSAMQIGNNIGSSLQKQMGLDRLLSGSFLGGPQQGAVQPQQASQEPMPSAAGGQMSTTSPMGSASIASGQSNKSIEDLFKEARKKGLI